MTADDSISAADFAFVVGYMPTLLADQARVHAAYLSAPTVSIPRHALAYVERRGRFAVETVPPPPMPEEGR